MAWGLGAKSDELPIPPDARGNRDASELARIWRVGDDTRFVLRAAWDDPAAWGLVLADLARHAARAEHRRRPEVAESTVLERILAGLRAELEAPTDQ